MPCRFYHRARNHSHDSGCRPSEKQAHVSLRWHYQMQEAHTRDFTVMPDTDARRHQCKKDNLSCLLLASSLQVFYIGDSVFCGKACTHQGLERKAPDNILMQNHCPGSSATMDHLYLVELLRQQAVRGAGLAHKLECAASKAGHDGVALAFSIACKMCSTSGRYQSIADARIPSTFHITHICRISAAKHMHCLQQEVQSLTCAASGTEVIAAHRKQS